MKYLLDTHALLWYFDDSPRLPLKTREIVNRNRKSIYLCSVSLLEIAIKVSVGKLMLSLAFEEFLDAVKHSDIKFLQIEGEHLKRLAVLPFLHKDPFDRMLVATAFVENLTIITADANIHKYDVSCLW
ncbi:MAG: type II toxin-antitoxin system VapC family toxin [Planctomycetaceae bacterium]|nr:type II toxin-antitoxin system VapC family toxin [Planctomycetaceae bacterium]